MKVLISGPNIYDARVYLPTTFLNLKTYVEHQAQLNNIEWLDPLFRNRPLEEMVKGINFNDVDVLGLSCYEWNWQLNTKIASYAKKINPEIKVVAGGPHPDYKNPKFWDQYPMIDIVVHHDGEKAFASILQGIDKSPGTATRDGIYPISLLDDFRHSPWLLNKEWLLEFKKKHIDHPDTKAGVIMWETDRGCPFACSFCDWGSATMQKVRRIPMERIEQELEFFAKDLQIPWMWHVGANLGILPRDTDIVKKLVGLQKETKWLKGIQYNPSKNTPERSLEIGKMFFDCGLVTKHLISLQHTKQEVLDCIDRKNIPIARQIPLIEDMQKNKMPTVAQLIMGMPGDTVDLWLQSLTDTVEWGIHNELQAYDFQLLPNAPANSPAYRDKWQIETVHRRHLPHEKHMLNKKEKQALEEDFFHMNLDDPNVTEFIVSTKTYSKDDWVKMKLHTKLFIACHTGNLTKHISQYCRNTLGIPFYDFYKGLFDKLEKEEVIKKEVTKIQKFISNTSSVLEEKIDQIDDGNFYELEDRILFNFLYTKDWKINENFFQLIKEYVTENFLWNNELDDLLKTQIQLYLTPEYNPKKGKRIEMKYNWIEYFKKSNYTCHTPESQIQFSPESKECVWIGDSSNVSLTERAAKSKIDWHKHSDIDKRNKAFANTVIAARYHRGNRNMLLTGTYI